MYKNGTVNRKELTETLPPHNLEAEEGVLGSLLIDNEAIGDVVLVLQPEHFYRETNQDVYRAILALYGRGEPVDIVTVMEEVGRDIGSGDTENEAYLIQLIGGVPTSINALAYARLVKEKWTRRKMIAAASRVASLAYDGEMQIDEALNEAELAVLSVNQQSAKGNIVTAREAAGEMIDDLENDKPVGIPTGYADLDRCIGGLEPGCGYWFCAAEKMGKTAFLSGISLFNALRGRVVLRISAEMSAKQRTRRDIAAMTGISIEKLKRRDLTEAERADAYDALGRLSQLALVTDDTPGITPSQVRASINRVIRQYGRLDLVEVDYWQKLEPDRQLGKKPDELEEISKTLHDIIKDHRIMVPMIGTAQVLSKSIEQRTDKRPVASDVFGSSALMKDAYFMSYLYRDEYYNPETTPDAGVAELIVRLHRDGDTPTLRLYFNGPIGKFGNLKHEPAGNGKTSGR